MGALAELLKLGLKTAAKQADEVVPRVVSKVDDLSVFPKPQRMFPEDARPPGGEYLNPATQDILTGMFSKKGRIVIPKEGPPSFKISPEKSDIIGSPDIKGATNIKTNLLNRKKTGWVWKKIPEGYDNVPAIVSIENKGKHYYALDVDFPKGVNLKRYADKKDEPRLRPTVEKGFVELGDPVGIMVLRGKEHPVYDKIINREEGGQVLPVIEKNIGGQVLDGLDEEYMRQRNSKEKLEKIIGLQHGGGLDDAYLNMSRRRSNAFADPNANTAFDSPMSMGGLPTVYRDNGGTMIPKERMISNQPHQLSYINPEEAGLLQALGGSGRRVNGIPTYDTTYDGQYGSITGEDYSDDGSGDNSNASDYWQDPGEKLDAANTAAQEADSKWASQPVTEEDDRQQAEDDKMYSQYGDAYGEQMSVDPDDPSGYLDSYADDFGRTGFAGLWGQTKTRNQALKENEAALRDAYGRAYGEERGNLIFNQQLAAPGGYHNVSYSFGRPGDFEGDYIEGLVESLTTTNAKGEKVVDTKNIETTAKLYGLEYKAVDKDEKSKDSLGVSIAQQAGKFVAGRASPVLGAALGLYGLLNNNSKVGTLTDSKSGMSFSVHEDGTVTNDEPVSTQPDSDFDYNEEHTPKKKRILPKKVIPKKVEEPSKGMKAYFAKKDKPVSRYDSNKHNRELLKSLGYDNINLG